MNEIIQKLSEETSVSSQVAKKIIDSLVAR